MNPKVMVIDAHPVYVDKTVGFLGSLTFKDVVVVARGPVALEAVKAHKPDVIVLSATLPDIDSIALAEQIKSQYSAVAIIVQTGLLIDHQAIEAFKDAGVEHIVPRLEKDWSAFHKALMDVLSSQSNQAT